MSRTNHAGHQADEPAGQFGRLAAAGLLAAAGGLHLAALPGHLSESTVAGAFFAVTAAAQLLGAVLVATRPSSRTYRAVLAGNVGVLTLWLMSRTTGLPVGGELGASEPFGLLDGLAAAAELLVVVAGVTVMVRRAAPSGRRPGALRLALALALTWGLSGGAGLAVAGDGHHHGDAHAHDRPAFGGHSHRESDLTQPADSRPSQKGLETGEPLRDRAHDAPAGSGHSEDPSVSSLVTEPGCPAGHDCTDHPH